MTTVTSFRAAKKVLNRARGSRWVSATWPGRREMAISNTDFATSTEMVVCFMADSSSPRGSFSVANDFGTMMPLKSWEESIASIQPKAAARPRLMPGR